MRRFVVTLLAAALLLPAAAGAYPQVTLYMDYFGGGYNSVRGDFYFNGGPKSGVYVGAWMARQGGAGGTHWADMYCVQLEQGMAEGNKLFTLYPTDEVLIGGADIGLASYDGLQWAAAIYNHNWQLFHTVATDEARMQRAALQMAIWEALYDFDETGAFSNSITAGTFRVTHLWSLATGYSQTDLEGYAQAFLDNPAYQYAAVAGYYDNGQNVIGPIPEPGGILLLGAGLAGAILVARLRR